MRLVDAQARLLALKLSVFTTSDAAAILEIKTMHASKILARLCKANLLQHLIRGLWATKDFNEPLLLPEYITSPLPSYISLQTALYYHGMISQIPNVIYAMTLSRSKYWHTSLADLSLHHCNVELFSEYEILPNSYIKMATKEKSLFDIAYLSPAKTLLFTNLPEIEISQSIDLNKISTLIKQITSKRLQTIVTHRLQKLIKL